MFRKWIGFCLLFALAPFQATAQNGGGNITSWQGSWPAYFSGTNCNAIGFASWNNGSYITFAKLEINGTIVKQYFYSEETQAMNMSLGVRFDSTHFNHLDALSFRVYAVNSYGETFDFTRPGQVYNLGYAYGNHSLASFGGDLLYGTLGTENARAAYSSARYGIEPATVAIGVRQDKPTILSHITGATVLYGLSHGQPGAFHDSRAKRTMTIEEYDATIVNPLDVLPFVALKGDIPGYQFVYLDMCLTRLSFAMAIALIPDLMTKQNRAYLGWPMVQWDSRWNTDWAGLLWGYLGTGYHIKDAIDRIESSYGMTELLTPEGGTERIRAVVGGDQFYKFHGLYGLPNSLAWYQ